MKAVKPASAEKCAYCESRACWRSQHLGTLQRYACEKHRPQLAEYERSTRDDGYMSEADHQTWERL